MRTELELQIQAQPDETTCGPTCLQAVYRYYGEAIPLERVIAETPRLPEGGTLGVSVGRHALGRRYRVTVYTYNLLVFDPTWFRPGAPDIRSRLAAEAREKRGEKLRFACEQYIHKLPEPPDTSLHRTAVTPGCQAESGGPANGLSLCVTKTCEHDRILLSPRDPGRSPPGHRSRDARAHVSAYGW